MKAVKQNTLNTGMMTAVTAKTISKIKTPTTIQITMTQWHACTMENVHHQQLQPRGCVLGLAAVPVPHWKPATSSFRSSLLEAYVTSWGHIQETNVNGPLQMLLNPGLNLLVLAKGDQAQPHTTKCPTTQQKQPCAMQQKPDKSECECLYNKPTITATAAAQENMLTWTTNINKDRPRDLLFVGVTPSHGGQLEGQSLYRLELSCHACATHDNFEALRHIQVPCLDVAVIRRSFLQP
jgi:hypothetical protein